MSRIRRRPGSIPLLVITAVVVVAAGTPAGLLSAVSAPPEGSVALRSGGERTATGRIAPAPIRSRAASTSPASALTVRPAEPGRPGDGVYGGERFQRRVSRAAARVAQELATPRGASCRDYFTEHGVDVVDWLELAGPPYVKEIDVRGSGRTFAWTQSAPPFEWLFLCTSCLPEASACPLGSLLLHELGHLARGDTADNEPPEFLARCRISRCIDAGRYR